MLLRDSSGNQSSSRPRSAWSASARLPVVRTVWPMAGGSSACTGCANKRGTRKNDKKRGRHFMRRAEILRQSAPGLASISPHETAEWIVGGTVPGGGGGGVGGL